MSIAQRLQDKGRQEGLQKGLQQGLQQGREEGREEGREQGMYEAKITMATQLLKNGVSPEIIMKTTGLNRDILASLK